MKTSEKIKRFLDIKVSLYKEKNTYINYRIDLMQLDLHMKNILGEDWLSTVDNDEIELYIKSLKDKGYEDTTINRKIASASSFFGYCEDKGWIDRSPMRGIELFKIHKKKKDVLEVKDVRRMIACTYKRQAREKNFEFNSARNRFILALLTTTGLRIGELININLRSLEKVEGGYMINIAAEDIKNNVEKRVPIANKTLEYFEEYMNERSLEGFESDVLILSRTGRKLTREGVQNMISKYCDRIGLSEKNITPHTFRHSCTGMLRRNRVEDSLIYNILGWKEGIISVYTDDISMLDSAKIISCNIL